MLSNPKGPCAQIVYTLAPRYLYRDYSRAKVYAQQYIYIYILTFVYMYVYIYTLIYIYIYRYMCMYIYMYACGHVCIRIYVYMEQGQHIMCIYIYTYPPTQTHLNLHIQRWLKRCRNPVGPMYRARSSSLQLCSMEWMQDLDFPVWGSWFKGCGSF